MVKDSLNSINMAASQGSWTNEDDLPGARTKARPLWEQGSTPEDLVSTSEGFKKCSQKPLSTTGEFLLIRQLLESI